MSRQLYHITMQCLASAFHFDSFSLASVDTLCPFDLKGHTTQQSGHMGQFCFQNESMVEIYSKSLVRAIGKILLMEFN